MRSTLNVVSRLIVPGGGLSPDGAKWVACRPGFFLHVRVLSRLFRRLFLEGLMALHRAGELVFFGDLTGLAGADDFVRWLAPFRKSEWVVYAKPPFGGPEAVLAYLSRYTPPGGDLERPSGQRRRRDRRLPLEGLPHQIGRSTKGDAVGHARVHSTVPDPCPTRRVPPHPALRPAGQFDPQGQHHEDPCLALRAAPGTGHRPKTRGRDHPTHPARTMPLLRRPHADHRDLPARAKTDVARTTKGAGRMTKRRSFVTENHQLQSADLVRTACACSFPASHKAAMTPKHTALSTSSPECASVSGTERTFSRTPDATVVPTDCTLSP